MTDLLSVSEIQRYSRQISIPNFGLQAQKRLKEARVLCIGAGGLGSPISLYLAAAGVGTIGLIDPDAVDTSNLQRQILYGTSDVGRAKLEVAAERLTDINPHTRVVAHPARFTAANALEIVADYDIVIDGTDNFPTRYLSNDVCVWLRKPNIYGSILRFEGQISVFAPHLGAPCYRCMVPHPPPPGLVPTCAEGGVLGVLPGIIGSMQALEAIKIITGIGEPLMGSLLHVETLSMRFRTIRLQRDPECPVCGTCPSITKPIDYLQFCGMSSPPSPTPPTLSVKELHQIREARSPHLLLDVREASEYNIARIEGATLIPLSDLPSRLNELPAGERIIVLCKLGGRSAKAANLLLENGFSNVWNVAGGITAWANEIDPSVPVY